MLWDIILAFFAVFGIYSVIEVIRFTVDRKIDRRKRKEYNREDKN